MYHTDLKFGFFLNYEVECKRGKSMFGVLKTYTEILEVRRIVLLLIVSSVYAVLLYTVWP
jgi:hypothetical protein